MGGKTSKVDFAADELRHMDMSEDRRKVYVRLAYIMKKAEMEAAEMALLEDELLSQIVGGKLATIREQMVKLQNAQNQEEVDELNST